MRGLGLIIAAAALAAAMAAPKARAQPRVHGVVASSSGRPAAASALRRFPLPRGLRPGGAMVRGPDGNIWFTATHGKVGVEEIVALSPAGTFRRFPVVLNGQPVGPTVGLGLGMVAGSDGAMWFAFHQLNRQDLAASATGVGRITTSGQMTLFPFPPHDPKLGSFTGPMVAGPDGAIYVAFMTTASSRGIARVTTDGRLTAIFPFPSGTIRDVVPGPDHKVWLSTDGGSILTLSPAGKYQTIARPAVGGRPNPAPGAGNTLWVGGRNRLARMTATGSTKVFTVKPPSGQYLLTPFMAGPDGRMWFEAVQFQRTNGPIHVSFGSISSSGRVSFSDLASRRIHDFAGLVRGTGRTIWFVTEHDAWRYSVPSGSG